MQKVFTYYALYPSQSRHRAEGRGQTLIAVITPSPPDIRTITVGWNHRLQMWLNDTMRHAEFAVNPKLNGRVDQVTRAQAQEISEEQLGHQLPSEERLVIIGRQLARHFLPPARKDLISFSYHLVFSEDLQQMVSLIAMAGTKGKPRAVIWDQDHEYWRSSPDLAMAMMSSQCAGVRLREVDRSTAESETPKFATLPLPTEIGLTLICRAHPDGDDCGF